MTKPLFIVASLLLTAVVVVLVGWQALFGITVLSFCTLLYSCEQPAPQPLAGAIANSNDAANNAMVMPADSGIEEAIDDDGWYYPLADKVLASAAANETSFGELEAGPAEVANKASKT